MILYGLCLNRLKKAIVQVDTSLATCSNPDDRIILEAYFMIKDDEIREYFSIHHSSRSIQGDLKEVSKALTRYMCKKLTLEFIEDRGGLCLCYYPKRNK